jgi:hypothetical protein
MVHAPYPENVALALCISTEIMGGSIQMAGITTYLIGCFQLMGKASVKKGCGFYIEFSRQQRAGEGKGEKGSGESGRKEECGEEECGEEECGVPG